MMFKVRGGLRGSHYHLVVYAGPDKDHLALCGELRMRLDECAAFCEALEVGLADLEIPAEILVTRPARERLREMEERGVL